MKTFIFAIIAGMAITVACDDVSGKGSSPTATPVMEKAREEISHYDKSVAGVWTKARLADYAREGFGDSSAPEARILDLWDDATQTHYRFLVLKESWGESGQLKIVELSRVSGVRNR